MYRRLVAWSMVIAGVGSLAFLIPLGMNVRQYQWDIAMVRAQQEAREVSSYATFIGDTARLGVTLRNLDYASTSGNDIVVWYRDGRALSATDPDRPVGAMPPSVERAFSAGINERPSSFSNGGEVELVWPAPASDGRGVVVQVVVPRSVLNENVWEKWGWLGAVATAIVLAAGVAAGRLGRHIAPPSASTKDRQPVG